MAREQTFYWHDYETFGIDPRRDRPAQFAGLRTDAELNPIGDPLVLHCRAPDDYLPDPGACLVTGITPEHTLAEGLPEAEFMERILRELARPGTCALGYNSIRFDDEVTRNALYRSLFDPYAREWKNGNSRWDIIDMVRLCRALRPEGIEWPDDEDGTPSFRLEALSAANRIAHESAHEALSDVRATIALARLIRERQPRLYQFVLEHRDKRSAATLLELRDEQPVIHVSARYPARRGCLALVGALARHPVNQNGVIVFDLTADPGPLLELDAEAIRERLFTPAAELPDGIERIPLKTVHLNKCPVLVPPQTLRPADAERLEIDPERCRSNLAVLRAAALEKKIREVFREPEREPLDDPDLMIYAGGFFSDADRARMESVHATDPRLLGELAVRFDDPRLPEMLFRYRARNWPQTLAESERQRWTEWRRERLQAGDGRAGSTLDAYRRGLAEIASAAPADAQRQRVVESLRAWADRIDPGAA